jgi:hypothetical protein
MAKREYETRYWVDRRLNKPISHGFPTSEEGGINGAAKAVGKGLASKVQRIHRDSGKVEWTIIRLPKVPGVNIYPYDVIRGDDEKKRSR